jgi:hypothetical protein
MTPQLSPVETMPHPLLSLGEVSHSIPLDSLSHPVSLSLCIPTINVQYSPSILCHSSRH